MISKTDSKLPLIVFEGLEAKNRFYTLNTEKKSPEDLCKLENGKVAYRILAYCETADEALAVIDGDGYDSIGHYADAHREKFKQMGIDPDEMEHTIRMLTLKDDLERIIRTPVQTLLDARNVHS